MSTPLEWRVEELAQELTRHREQLELLAQAVLGDDAEPGRERETPWTTWGAEPDRLGPTVTEAIGEWVCWLARTYGSDTPGRSLPACWPEHLGLVAELLTLHYTWRTAFLAARNADAAQTWHGLHLPGFLARVDLYVTRDCLTSRHRPQLPTAALCNEHRPAHGPPAFAVYTGARS